MKTKDIRVAVIDGQGGGVGKALIELFKKARPDINIRALGTNAAATSAMLKAGADDGATGENAILFNSAKIHIIAGPVGIIMPNGLIGELTPKMAEAIGASDAVKILIPSQQCGLRLSIGKYQSTKFYLDEAVKLFKEEIDCLTDGQ